MNENLEIIYGRNHAKQKSIVFLIATVFENKKRVALVGCLSLICVAVNTIALVTVFLVIQSLETGKIISIYNQSFTPGGDRLSIIISAFFIGFLVFLAACLSYFSRLLIVKIVSEKYADLIKITAHKYRQLAELSPVSFLKLPQGYLKKLVNGELKYVSICYGIVLGSLLPAGTLVFALGGIAYLSPILGMIIITVLIVSLPIFFYLFNRSKKLQESLSNGVRDVAEISKIIENQATLTPIHEHMHFRNAIDAAVNDKKFVNFQRFWQSRMSLNEHSQLVFGITSAAAFVFLTLYLGFFSGASGVNVSGIAALLFLFKHLLGSMNSLVSRGANLHSLIHIYGRYFAFESFFSEALNSQNKSKNNVDEKKQKFPAVVYTKIPVSIGLISFLQSQFNLENKKILSFSNETLWDTYLAVLRRSDPFESNHLASIEQHGRMKSNDELKDSNNEGPYKFGKKSPIKLIIGLLIQDEANFAIMHSSTMKKYYDDMPRFFKCLGDKRNVIVISPTFDSRFVNQFIGTKVHEFVICEDTIVDISNLTHNKKEKKINIAIQNERMKSPVSDFGEALTL
ncbi:hypothetical protein OAH90_02720 [Alphaproteobacteria bacterium]|nr:hypothetical protein [Alphaproteobacteria bacterium]